jgi:hypothetical protein
VWISNRPVAQSRIDPSRVDLIHSNQIKTRSNRNRIQLKTCSDLSNTLQTRQSMTVLKNSSIRAPRSRFSFQFHSSKLVIVQSKEQRKSSSTRAQLWISSNVILCFSLSTS